MSSPCSYFEKSHSVMSVSSLSPLPRTLFPEEDVCQTDCCEVFTSLEIQLLGDCRAEICTYVCMSRWVRSEDYWKGLCGILWGGKDKEPHCILGERMSSMQDWGASAEWLSTRTMTLNVLQQSKRAAVAHHIKPLQSSRFWGFHMCY